MTRNIFWVLYIYTHTQRQVSLLLPPFLATFSTPTFLALATERLFAFAAERFLATLAFAFAACLFLPLSIPSLLGLRPESAQRTGDHGLRMTGLAWEWQDWCQHLAKSFHAVVHSTEGSVAVAKVCATLHNKYLRLVFQNKFRGD